LQFEQSQGVQQTQPVSSTLTLAHQYQNELADFVWFVYPNLRSRRSNARWMDKSATQAGRTAGSKAAIAKHIIPKTRRLGGSL
ncbi:MAG: hypothetical protein WA902_22700, partial [Thermosynechococcaceae cyanobacterium]